MVPVLLSCPCPNKLPQTGWLKTTEVYSLTIGKARSPKSRCQQSRTPSKGSEKEYFLASSTSDGSRSSLACGCINPVSASVVTWPSPWWLVPSSFLSLTRTSVIGFKANSSHPRWFSYLKIFNWITSAKILFPNMVTFTGSRVKTWEYLFGGHRSTCYSIHINRLSEIALNPQYKYYKFYICVSQGKFLTPSFEELFSKMSFMVRWFWYFGNLV